MKVTQIYTLMNNVTKEVLGKTDLVKEDLSNVVDVGKEIFDNTSVDNYVKSLVNHIGKVIFVDRPYSGNIPSMMMDSWEFGSVLEKISADIPEATENKSWDLQDKQSYDTNVFYKPSVSAKFFNSRVTFEVPMSFTELQVKESFSSSNQLNGFLSMLYNAVDKSMTIKLDSLVMRTINNMIANTINAEFPEAAGAFTDKTGTKAVNLLKLYNDKFFPATGTGGTTPNPDALTVDKALTDAEFIKFATYTISNYKDRLSKISTLFNIGEKERFTPSDMLNIVMLSDFKNSASVFLESTTYHNELVALPKCETVPYWQGSGLAYEFDDVSKINVSVNDGTAKKDIAISGILAIMYDHDAMGVCNLDKRVTTNYNAKAEFYNNYYKFDAGYFNDFNENFVVFFIA